jgi:hypothetical protein
MPLGVIVPLLSVVALAPAVGAEVTFSLPVHEAPADNAWDHYRTAFELLPREGDLWYRVQRGPAEPSPEDVEALVAEAQPALRRLREGLGKPCVVPREPFDPLTPPDFSADARARQMARLLRWEGWLHAHRGDYGAAFASQLDALTLGQDVARQPGLLGKLVSIACETIACQAIRETVGEASNDRPALASLVGRLQTIEAGEVPYWETLAHEYEAALAWINWLRTPGSITREEFREAYGTRAIGAACARARREVDRFYSDAVAMAKRPEWEWTPGALAVPADDTLAGQLASPMLAADVVRRHLAGLRGTLLVAALEQYRAEHGRYPEQPAALVPENITALPLDPWTGDPFLYATTGDSCRVYSVGPDRRDDGGADLSAPPAGEGDCVFSTRD